MTEFDKKLKREPGQERTLKEVTIDLSRVPSWDTDALAPALERGLASNGLLKEAYLYSAFHPDMLKTVRSLGSARAGGTMAGDVPVRDESYTDSDLVFCVAARKGEDRKVRLERFEDSHLIDFLEERRDDDKSYVAVYARNLLESEDGRQGGFPCVRAGNGACRFSDPSKKLDALVAIVKVNFPSE